MMVTQGQQCGHSLKVRSCPEKTCFIFSPSFRLFRGLVGLMGLALTSSHSDPCSLGLACTSLLGPQAYSGPILHPSSCILHFLTPRFLPVPSPLTFLCTLSFSSSLSLSLCVRLCAMPETEPGLVPPGGLPNNPLETSKSLSFPVALILIDISAFLYFGLPAMRARMSLTSFSVFPGPAGCLAHS